MSIASKHAYRFQYLKSEQWQNVRLKALAREQGKCQICGEESIRNDAHHLWYPRNIYRTQHWHLAILCRACHDFLHSMRPNCKTMSERNGKRDWLQFQRAVVTWRTQKAVAFQRLNGTAAFNPLAFFDEITKVKTWLVAGGGVGRWITKEAVGQRFSKLYEMISISREGKKF